MPQRDIDPITLEVLWSKLQQIPEEMGTHFQRTAFSDIIKYAVDFSTVLTDPNGRLLSQGVYTPGHLGCMLTATKKVLEDHVPPDEWEEGDILVTNDPHLGAGHLPDIFTFEPVFLDDELIGFSVITANHIDVGGGAPGSITVYAHDVYEEGIQIPPVKLYEGGDLDEKLLGTILENSRAPGQVRGDLRAQRGASAVGVEQYRELVAEHGFETFQTYVDEIFHRTEVGLRESISDLPDGSYAFEQEMDSYDGHVPTLRVTITVEDDELTVDWSGTTDQVEGFAVNATRNYTFAYTMFGIKSAINPDIPQTDGSLSPVTVSVPSGSVLNAEHPAPVGARHILSNHIASTMNGALYEANPELVPAAGAQDFGLMAKFTDPETRDQQVHFDGIYGGGGAWHDRDGEPAIAGGPNSANTPVEVVEDNYPVAFHQYQFVPDTGGAGRHRGGSATVREYTITQPAQIQSYSERVERGAYGLDGGRRGAAGRQVRIDDDGETELGPKELFTVESGTRLRTQTPGGGGYGDPEDRAEAAVREDVRNGLVSPEAAATVYGVDVED
ncbi:hydantoinase B/oxoprolinase family protein [Halovivax cerinus]|uniref:Hydantoinase B/oxoprolinase family protein n=1 Tax=Halovivax cerinus TaxID=1487865 RepID=A0ABD5NR00_9EURY|nr:hydantoinase B/oxoprolinase family protein [Halovivax cerinus]